MLDVGCGPGRITRFLADAGVAVQGVDLAPGMVRAARSAHPDLTFDVADLNHLPFDDGSMAGVVYWYSIITTPPERLDGIWAELDGCLTTAGWRWWRSRVVTANRWLVRRPTARPPT